MYLMPRKKQVLDYFPDLVYFPKSIFKTNLTVFEAIVYYLKEERKLAFHEIASMLNRDERNIWTIYSRARRKAKKWTIKH